ncbi:MAG: flagellar biosynthesis protein FliQ [Candidatus Eremiobacterota bacterium]
MLILGAEAFTKQFLLDLISEGLHHMLWLSMPMLIAAIAVGVLISVLQAATQVQEQTLSFVPKIVATFVSVIMYGAWISSTCTEFTIRVLSHIKLMGHFN